MLPSMAAKKAVDKRNKNCIMVLKEFYESKWKMDILKKSLNGEFK